jgi:AmmeMemoRadiSam system protein A
MEWSRMTGPGAGDGPVLTGLARAAIGRALGLPAPHPPSVPILDDYRGAFVTIMLGGRLRGCMGRVEADQTVRVIVPSMACTAAFEDPRFAPLRREELERVSIEVSLLSAPVAVDAPEAVVAGTHGVIVSAAGRRGLLLPQVAVEWNWSREDLLDHACEKASLPRDAWRRPDTRIETFTADVFQEDA